MGYHLALDSVKGKQHGEWIDSSVIDAVESGGSVGSHQMRARAIDLGRKLRQVDEPKSKNKRNIFPAIEYPLEQIVSEIVEGHHAAVQWAKHGEDVSPIVDWMLDNYYILSERIDEIRVDLPPGFLKELPRVRGVPRMQALASELLLLSDCSLDEALIVEFVCAFQETCDVRIGELWALSTWLKLCLWSGLARLRMRWLKIMPHCFGQVNFSPKLLHNLMQPIAFCLSWIVELRSSAHIASFCLSMSRKTQSSCRLRSCRIDRAHDQRTAEARTASFGHNAGHNRQYHH